MENIQNITIDIMNNKYSDYIYAKQYDRNRVVNFTITENGKKKSLDNTTCTFLMKGKEVISFMNLVRNGDIYTMSMTDNETHEHGKIPYQLVLSTGEVTIGEDEHGDPVIVWGDGSTIIGTVTGYVLVEQCVVNDDDVATQFDSSLLSDLLAEVKLAQDVIDDATEIEGQIRIYANNASGSATKSESWAVGGTATREGEDTNNSKYYSEVSKSYAIGGTDIPHGDKPDTQDNAKYFYEQTEALKDQYIVTETIELRTTGQAAERVGVWNVTTRECEVALPGIKADENEQLIIVRPYNNTNDVAYTDEYIRCNVRCIQQLENKLKFKCDIIPNFNLNVHVNTQFVYVAGDIRKSNIIVSDTEPSSNIMNTNDFWVQDYTVPPNNEEVGA